MRFTKLYVLGVILVALTCLTGCQTQTVSADSKPTEAVARKLVEQQISQNASGLIKLRSFKKTNGMDAANTGVAAYQLEYKAEIEALDNATLLPDWGGSPYVVVKNPQEPGGNPLEKGKIYTYNSIIIYTKTENGWKPN